MLGQARSRGAVVSGLQQHGVAPGGRKMLDLEEAAASEAIANGEESYASHYVTPWKRAMP